MPKYRFPLANGRSLVLEGDQMPTDADVEAAAQQAGVRALLMKAGDEGEAPATGLSDSPTSNPISTSTKALGGVAAGMAGAPTAVAAVNAASRLTSKVAPGLAPVATAAAVANDLKRGEYRNAAVDAATGTVASKYLPAIVHKVASAVERATSPAVAKGARDLAGRFIAASQGGGVARAAGVLRGASPYAAGLTGISALHSINQQQYNAIMDNPNISPEVKSAMQRTLRQIADRESR